MTTNSISLPSVQSSAAFKANTGSIQRLSRQISKERQEGINFAKDAIRTKSLDDLRNAIVYGINTGRDDFVQGINDVLAKKAAIAAYMP